MSLAALGCNPEAKGASLADIGGAALGTLAYSPDGGMYIAVRSDGATGTVRRLLHGGRFRH